MVFFNKTLWPTRAKFGCKPVDFINCIFGIDGLPGTEMKTTVVLGGISINKYIFQKKIKILKGKCLNRAVTS